MYQFAKTIDESLKNEVWSSKYHREIAIRTCIGNPALDKMKDLIHNINIINAIPMDEIHEITIPDLILKGCKF
jgi:hypothetical protein